MNILGISAYYHDSAAALIADGRIVAAAEEERFTRKKHDSSFPQHALEYCLREAALSLAQVDYLVFYEKPLLKFDRLLETYLTVAPAGWNSFRIAMPVWLRHKLMLPDDIRKKTGFKGRILFTGHHESHAASAFFPSPFREAAVICFDGVGEWATTCWGMGRGNTVELKEQIQFPHSLGLLYSAFTHYTGFKVNSGEYKVMGLAPYGRPRFVDDIRRELVDIKEDGSFHMNMEYFNYCQGLTMTSRKFDALFGGPPRQPEEPLTQREMDLASSIQAVTEEIMIKIARFVRQQTGMKALCLAGGVALNCVGNGKLDREGMFDRIWVQPAAGDAGGALGAALAVHHHYLGGSREPDGVRDSQRGSYLGPSFSNAGIREYLRKNNYPFIELSEPELVRQTADRIAAGEVVGWFQGRMEFGPRALGARSILADARKAGMQKKMNLKIKFRESFRPFAASVLREHASEWFDLEQESPYMTLVARVKPERTIPLTEEQHRFSGLDKLNVARSSVPAVTHVDYSSRIQTVDKDVAPRFHKLLSVFFENTGCPLVVNTSFNLRGEPIVCTPLEAYRCFMRTDMDVLILENCLLERSKQPAWIETSDWRRELASD